MQTSWHGDLPLERSLTVFGRSAQDGQTCQTTATIAARPMKEWMNDWHKEGRGKEKKRGGRDEYGPLLAVWRSSVSP